MVKAFQQKRIECFVEGKFLSIPLSLKSEEQQIIAELRRKNLQVFFKITYFDPETGDMEYNLADLDPLQEIPVEADEIVKKSLAIWREKYP
jgi:hypothetical protein